MTRYLGIITAAATLASCGDSHREAERRDSNVATRVRSGAHRVGHKTSGVFHRIGGHLQKFFTGRDTLSR